MDDDEQEWLGEFWLPEVRHRIGGRLKFARRGADLLLLADTMSDWSGIDLHEGVGFPLDPPFTIPLIYGRSNTRLSIIEATCDMPVPPGMDGAETWHADAIIEAHVPDTGAEPTFPGIRFDLDLLPKWSRARGIARRAWFNEQRHEFTAQPHDLGSVTFSDGTTLHIRQQALVASADYEHVIRQPVMLEIDNAPSATWRNLLNTWLRPIQVLLWVTAGRGPRPGTIEVRVDDENRGAHWAKLWVNLVDQRTAAGSSAYDDVLFHADELPGGLLMGIQRWLALWASIRHVIDPLYARSTGSFSFANDRFYSAAAAIEAYHRYCVDSDRDLPRSEHRARIARLGDVLSEHAPDLRVWAVGGLQEFNRIPLRRRIEQIAATIPDVQHALFGDHIEAFAHAVEQARNGHAHALVDGGSLDDGAALYGTADALAWLLRTAWLTDLGFRIDQAQNRVLRHARFQHTVRTMERLLPQL